jgi:hypothetical protein
MSYAIRRLLPAAAILSAIAAVASASGRAPTRGQIQPWTENPSYWQYKGQPVLLLGGSDDDNLFQWPAEQLRPHLDRMHKAGANYVRNTMSDRPDKGFELYPFLRLTNGKFDLNRWNPEYWQRFEQFLKWTAERNIVVQIEIWDRFDYSRENWPPHPYNPKNNVNYSGAESGLDAEYPDHPGRNKQPFFFTTPAQRNNRAILPHQQRFVEKMLSYSLKHDHVLYCMDNETNGEEEWSRYWAEYVKAAAGKTGVRVYVTEMWDDWDLRADRHRRTFDHPDLYDFVDISQNNHNSGEKHWANALWVRQYIASHPRPINTVKTYGATGNKFGHSDQDGIERFWRHILAGLASARFHRPDSGLGLNDKAEAAVRSARKMESLVKAWQLSPRSELLLDRMENSAYAAAEPGKAYVVYLPAGGSVSLAVEPGKHEVKWIDVNHGDWGPSERATSNAPLRLTAPGGGHWVAVVLRAKEAVETK